MASIHIKNQFNATQQLKNSDGVRVFLEGQHWCDFLMDEKISYKIHETFFLRLLLKVICPKSVDFTGYEMNPFK